LVTGSNATTNADVFQADTAKAFATPTPESANCRMPSIDLWQLVCRLSQTNYVFFFNIDCHAIHSYVSAGNHRRPSLSLGTLWG